MNFNYGTKKNLSKETEKMGQNECKSKFLWMEIFENTPLKYELELTIRDNCPQSRVSRGLSFDSFSSYWAGHNFLDRFWLI